MTPMSLGGFTKGAKEFANKNNIELWDVDDILNLSKQTDSTQPGTSPESQDGAAVQE